MSAKSRNAIRAKLSQHYEHVGIKIINNYADLLELVTLKPDLVFLGMKYIPDVDGLGLIWVSEFLDEHKITHTGSDHLAHQQELNKHIAKQSIMDAGQATSDYIVLKNEQIYCNKDIKLAYPLFVKPTNLGGGQGIDSYSVVANFEELQSKVDMLRLNLKADVLIEQYLSGREFSVAILKDVKSDQLQAMPIELVAPKNQNGERILSKEVKQSDAEQAIEVTDLGVKAKVCDLAVNVFKTLDGRDYGRIDIRMDKFGSPNFLEANLIPSLISGYGSFPKACLINENIDYQEMLLSIVSLAFSRQNVADDFVDSSDTNNVVYEPISALA